MDRNAGRNSGAGFTLVEVILAIGIVAVAGSLLLTSLAQSVRSEGKNRARDAALRLEDVVRMRLREIGFEELYVHLEDREPVFYVYRYRADPESFREDDTPKPATSPEGIMVPALRHRSDPLFPEDLKAVEGDVFRLRLTPFLHDSGEPFALPPRDEYEPAALRLFVEIYQDFSPGEGEDDWPDRLRVLSFPVSLAR